MNGAYWLRAASQSLQTAITSSSVLHLIGENIAINLFKCFELNSDVFIVIIGQNYFEFCHDLFVPPIAVSLL